MMNDTPRRIEASPVSVIIERPGMLGEMRLGLDDPIPLMTGTPSKYRTPSMLTPKGRKKNRVKYYIRGIFRNGSGCPHTAENPGDTLPKKGRSPSTAVGQR